MPSEDDDIASDSSETDGGGETDQSDLQAFLNKSGAVELLASVGRDGVRFGYLEESLGISHDTVSKHLAMAQDLELIEPESVRGERGVTHKYVLTYIGERIYLKLKAMGAVDDYHLLQMYRKDVEEHEKEIREWVEEQEQKEGLDDRYANADQSQIDYHGYGLPTEESDDE
ncbi:hypothetical protein [Halorientalis salina]|uniref:hypothetical protein n=1 Tax=Halorientalis salina TaxID=2932266 RepID=UPI0010AC0071|nr:hypothetical protein [Halorientalis salina]